MRRPVLVMIISVLSEWNLSHMSLLSSVHSTRLNVVLPGVEDPPAWMLAPPAAAADDDEVVGAAGSELVGVVTQEDRW